MESSETACSCGLKLGVDDLSTKGVIGSDKKYKILMESIHFLGQCNSSEKCTIQSKIDEIKERISEYYFEKEAKLIAIPNQIKPPKKLLIIDADETDVKKRKANAKYMDKFYEDTLHQTIIKALREMKLHGFIMEGFQSEDCLKAKLEKGKQLRKEMQCKCKSEPDTECTCGKVKYPELNTHEKDVMEILDIKDITGEELLKSTELLKNINKDTKSVVNKGDTWLFHKVWIFVLK